MLLVAHCGFHHDKKFPWFKCCQKHVFQDKCFCSWWKTLNHEKGIKTESELVFVVEDIKSWTFNWKLSWVPWGSTNLPWCCWCPNTVFTMATKFMIQLYTQSGQNCVHTRVPWQLSLITLFSEVLKFSKK